MYENPLKAEGSPIHEDVIAEVLEKLPPEETLYEVSEMFRVFGDSSRARIICALSESEMCVGDLSILLGMSQSAVSHQLRVLKQARLVKSRRNGKVIYYSLADDHIKMIFNMAFDHVMEEYDFNLK